MNCRSCGVDVSGKRFCTNCGTATPLGTTGPFVSPGSSQAQSPPLPPPGHAAQPSGKRISAGICAILLGGLGIHKFVLGYTTAGIIMLVIGLFSCGVVSAVIGLIEGIIYLTKSDQEFDAIYVHGKKEWF